jgi:hypothetical protein
MEEIESVETIELDEQRFITLEFARRWPKYVVSWSLRHRVGEADFPLAGGTVDRLPPRDGPAEPVWDALREAARSQAMAAAQEATTEPERKQSFLGRLFGRG